MFDIVIKNGIIVDGTGKPRFRGDIGIHGDRVAGVGELDSSGRRILDVEGCVVSPGFIDIHSHTDELVLANPTCESKVTQGVTTEVSGNCGDSAAPRGGRQNLQEVSGWLAEHGIELNWQSLGEFLDRLEEEPMSINFATFVGQGLIRSAVVGYEDRAPTDSEMDEMCRLVEGAVKDGALGLSTGLIYPPSCYAKTEELIRLCKSMAPYGGIYATHMRNESERLFEALDEAIRIGREAGVGVQISHHKACGRKVWGKVTKSLEMIDEARRQGLDIWADQYPYIATSTGLGVVLPKWAHDGGKQALLERLRNKEDRLRLTMELQKDTSGGWIFDSGGWDSVVISSVKEDRNRFCEGLSIAQIAEQVRKNPVDMVMDLLLDEQGSVGMMHFVINDKDVETIMRHPAVIVGSDATARSKIGPLGRGKTHPRAYGTFARVLGKYVREDGVLSLEEAVAKMTGRSAKRLSFHKRGILAEGFYADIAVFDPETIRDTADFGDPHKHATGVKYVLVNGRIALDDGQLLDPREVRSGRVLRRGVS